MNKYMVRRIIVSAIVLTVGVGVLDLLIGGIIHGFVSMVVQLGHMLGRV